MKIPSRLIPLVEDGIIDEVLGQVRSGKEADVFIVRVGEEIRCAKVYKEANNRSFRQAVQYQEGRKVQNSRSARAMSKRTNYGQKEAETSWINAEVEALNKLSAAGIRVPMPFGFFDGVLIMELIVDEDGQPAPRLNDISLSPETALLYHEELISQIVRMLCLGIIHGDLSEFNVLVDAEGPVIIDLPQAVNAAGNNSAGMMFARDVNNMAGYFGRFEPGILGLKYAKEIWALYETGKLTPHAELTGQFQEPTRSADVGGVLNAIGDARKEHEDRVLKKALREEERKSKKVPEDDRMSGKILDEDHAAETGRGGNRGHGGHGGHSGHRGPGDHGGHRGPGRGQGQGQGTGNDRGPGRTQGGDHAHRGPGGQGGQPGHRGPGGNQNANKGPGGQGGDRSQRGPGSPNRQHGNDARRPPEGKHSSGAGPGGNREPGGRQDGNRGPGPGQNGNRGESAPPMPKRDFGRMPKGPRKPPAH
ncbi:MAG: family serine kinase [Fibrobacteres bacterium]|nr:family serine kinase [Fibrobacterota bacterium]